MSTVGPDTNTPWAAAQSQASAPDWPPPPPPPPPGFDLGLPGSRISGTGRRLIIGSLLCALVIGGVFIYRELQPKTWDPVLEPYVAFVEAERGLSFDHPVEVRWANIAQDLEESFAAEGDNSIFAIGDDDALDPYAEAYRLLGLVDPDPEGDLLASQQQTATENAGAFYEPWSETIVLPEGGSLEALSFTIVHELAHALQDQNGMLAANVDTIDGSIARTALIEGDAERVATAWYWQLSDAERQAYLDATGYDPDTTFDDPGGNFLAASFYASYAIGLPMTQTIVATEGTPALNRLLLADDVGTTERFLDVIEASPRSRIDAIALLPLPPGAEFADGDLGALAWFQALAPLVGTEAAFDWLEPRQRSMP
jgi:hypothetical protein